jgi:DNA-binding response OmpR family regulator
MTIISPTVLVIHGDPIVREFLADNLAADNYTVLCAGDAARAHRHLESDPHAIVLGPLNNGTGSLRLLRELVAADAGARILMLGADDNDLAAVRSLEAGADDYMRSPFSYPELRARVNRLVRIRERRRGRMQIGTLSIDLASRETSVDGREVELSRLEFRLLTTLASDPARVFGKEELLEAVWGQHAHAGQPRLPAAAQARRRRSAAHGLQHLGCRLPVA